MNIPEIWREGREAEHHRLEREETWRRKAQIEHAWRQGREAEALRIEDEPQRKGCRFWPFGRG